MCHNIRLIVSLMLSASCIGVAAQATGFTPRAGTEASSDITGSRTHAPIAWSSNNTLPLPPSGPINSEINAALNSTACSIGCQINLPAGSATFDAPITIPARVRIHCNNTSIAPAASMTALFLISGGLSGIQGCQLNDVGGAATYAIQITKPTDNLPIDIDENYIGSFTEGIIATNGADDVHISRNMMVSTGLAIDAHGANLNWTIGPANFILGSSGILMHNAGGGDEGFEIFGNTILPSGAAGSHSYCLAVNGGLETTFTENICDQIVSGDGIDLNGNIDQVNGTKITHNWIGRNYEASGAAFGIYSYQTYNTIIEDNTITGFASAGVYASGTDNTHGKGLIIHGNNFYVGDRVTKDLYLDYQDDVTVADNYFNGSISNFDTTNGVVSGAVKNNRFTMPVPILGSLLFGPQIGSFQGPTYTVSQLNASIPCTSALENVQGPLVTDASSPTYLVTLTGSGATKAPSRCIDGHWVAD